MKRSKNILPKMHLVCGNDDLRPQFDYVEVKNGIATATNAYVLVRYDLTELMPEDVIKFLDGKFVHKDFWKLLCQSSDIEINTMTSSEDSLILPILKYGKLTKLSYTPEVGIKYPDYLKIMLFDECLNTENAVPSIGINPNLLTKLFDVSKSNYEYGQTLVLHFYKESQMILTRSTMNDRFIGLIMPTMSYEQKITIDRFKQ